MSHLSLTDSEKKYVEKRVKRMSSNVGIDVQQAYLEGGDSIPDVNVIAAEVICVQQKHYNKAFKQWIRRANRCIEKKEFILADEMHKKSVMAEYARLFCVIQFLPK